MATIRQAVEAWWPLIRDVWCVTVGTILLVSQIRVQTPDPTVIGAGMVLLGVSASGRIQEWARRRNGNGGSSG